MEVEKRSRYRWGGRGEVEGKRKRKGEGKGEEKKDDKKRGLRKGDFAGGSGGMLKYLVAKGVSTM